MSRCAKLFFAISHGVKQETRVFKRYVGYADVQVITVNPSLDELNKLYNNNGTEAPVYVKEVEVGQDKHKAIMSTVRFVVKNTLEDGTELLNQISFNVRKEFRMNNAKDKIQVIDKYGRTAWVTKEQFAAKQIPMYSNGPAPLDPAYRPCYFGEENLVSFLKVLLNIPSVDKLEQVDGKWKRTGMIDDPSTAECMLDMDKLFKGDFSEIKEAISYQPENQVKVLFGVRKTDDNKLYQQVYTDMFLRPNTRNFNNLLNDVTTRQQAGAYPNVIFEVCPLKEFVEQASVLPTASSSAAPAPFDPFASATTDAPSSEDDDLPFGM